MPAEALGGLREQKFGCALGVGNDLRIPEADDAPAHAFQIGGPFRVIGFLVEMLATVQFDCQLRLAASKIDDIGPNDKLPGERRSIAG